MPKVWKNLYSLSQLTQNYIFFSPSRVKNLPKDVHPGLKPPCNIHQLLAANKKLPHHYKEIQPIILKGRVNEQVPP